MSFGLLLGAILLFAPPSPALAQSATACADGNSPLLTLGKEAFFRSIERGAFAIGERTLDDLADGLGDTGQAKRVGAKRPANASARARAAVFTSASSAAITEPLTAYVDSPSSEAAEAALTAFLEKSVKILFEKLPDTPSGVGSVGLVLENGQLFNGGAQWQVTDMANERKRQNLEFSLFGDGPDLLLGKGNKVLGANPFLKAPVIADARNVDRNNIGIEIQKESALRDLWFKDYRGHLLRDGSALDPAQVTEALNAGWPTVQKFWTFKRLEIFVTRAQAAFDKEMRDVYRTATSDGFRANDCGASKPK